MKISQKLAAALLTIVVLTLALGGVSIIGIRMIESETKLHRTFYAPVSFSVTHIKMDLGEIVRATEEYDANWMDREESTEVIEENKKHIGKNMEQLSSLMAGKKGLFTAKELDGLKGSIGKIYEFSSELFSLHDKSRQERAPTMGELDEGVEEASQKLNVMLAKIETALETSMANIRATVVAGRTASFFIVIFVILVLLIVALVVSRSIVRPIIKLKDATLEISKGKLDTRAEVKSGDEIGDLARSFNQMISDLQKSNIQLKEIQAQLIQSSKMASIGQLAGGVAHEINNPLTGVLNNIQLIKMIKEQSGKEIDSREEKKLFDAIEESALRCKKITQSLLDFSHVSKGQHQQVSLNDIIEKITALTEHELRLQNVAIKKDFASDLPLVSVDPQLLQQAILDIITNARWAIQQKSGSKDGGAITIKTSIAADNKHVEVVISDTGIGIPRENLNKIFDPFFTTKEIGEGTGLGLAVVYNIIEAHRGSIEVESEPGKGSIFKITLPVGA